MHHKYRAALTSFNLLCSNIEFVNILLTTDNGFLIGTLIMSMFHFLSFRTRHTFWYVAPWLCKPYIHIQYCYIQHNLTFPTSYHMCFYDNPWQSNYKVNENILHRYHFFCMSADCRYVFLGLYIWHTTRYSHLVFSNR